MSNVSSKRLGFDICPPLDDYVGASTIIRYCVCVRARALARLSPSVCVLCVCWVPQVWATIASVPLFGFELGLNFFIGMVAVLVATLLYSGTIKMPVCFLFFLSTHIFSLLLLLLLLLLSLVLSLLLVLML